MYLHVYKKTNTHAHTKPWFHVHSAAKAPYLARFRVRRCGINELENVAMAVSSQHSSQSQQLSIKDSVSSGLKCEMWQAAIFKVSA
jgi:phosphatidylinositol 4-kinase